MHQVPAVKSAKTRPRATPVFHNPEEKVPAQEGSSTRIMVMVMVIVKVRMLESVDGSNGVV